MHTEAQSAALLCTCLSSRPGGKPRPAPNAGCDTDQCIAAFGRFAAATAQHFRGRGIVFECLNEPNGMGNDNATDIAAICLAAGQGFAEAGEVFVGPATAGIMPLPYLQARGRDWVPLFFDTPPTADSFGPPTPDVPDARYRGTASVCHQNSCGGDPRVSVGMCRGLSRLMVLHASL